MKGLKLYIKNGAAIELCRLEDEEAAFLIKHFPPEIIRMIGVTIACGMDKNTVLQNLQKKIDDSEVSKF